MILKGEDIDVHKNNTNDSNGKDGTDVNVVDMTQAAAFEFYRMKGKLPLLCAQIGSLLQDQLHNDDDDECW